ncbi:MAG: inositol monophosphatase, partial [Bacteroidales bacterium]|nr:inositol monophosphatase [Bacteroidales bacterium]
MDYRSLTESVVSLTKTTGQYLKSQLGSMQDLQIEVKGQMDFVTRVDKSSEHQLVEALSNLLPESGFIAEEGTSTKKGERFNWIIDPLDGTTNFIHGVIPFCISIALMDKDELVIGVVYDPVQDECFAASSGNGAWLNNQRIQVSTCNRLSSALIATGFPYTDFSLIDSYMESLQTFMEVSHGVRRLGSAAIDLAYVACGRYDGFYEYHLKPW